MFFYTFVLLLTQAFCYVSSNGDPTIRVFPRSFKFGVATAAYQIEGGWDADGKGENIWDNICHTNPSFVDNEDNGDVACDSYHKWEQDVENIKALNVDFYRFSLSWSRILPTGRLDNVNSAGIEYYQNLLSALVQNGIEPMVTLYHWDLPQPLQEIGGWTNPELETLFGEYARLAFENFGDVVKTWITINEPIQICYQGYGLGVMAPGIESPGLADYQCAHNVIKAHARAWHIYDDEFRSLQNGRISITTDTAWFEPASEDPRDEEAAERIRQFTFGWYSNPIYNRNYPRVMIERIAERSAAEGHPKSRLPVFTEEELDYISGTHDFLGLNVYTTLYVSWRENLPIGEVSYANDVGVTLSRDDSWEGSASSWLKVVPWGIRKLVNWVKNTYNDPEIVITENGFSDLGGELFDTNRVNFYKEYLSNLLDAMLYDGVKCSAYTAWSLMDNFEWARGYKEKFGLYSVDFNDPERKRSPKLSAYWYKTLARTHILF